MPAPSPAAEAFRDQPGRPQPRPNESRESLASSAASGDARLGWILAVGLGIALLWAFWPTLLTMARRWSADPQYSHGFLVPLFALTVLWFRREQLKRVAWQPSWWGLPVLAGGLALHLVGGRMDFEPIAGFSLLPALAGLVLFVGGWSLLAWSWPAIAFLAFMLPLPFILETALAQPLRRLATVMATYCLQTLGYPALSEGNIIFLGPLRMGVVEACSGLGMLMTFFALATALVLILQAPLADRIVLIVSAIPIAVLANVARVTITGVAFYETGDESVQQTLHDMAGLGIMMPLALLLFWLELCFLRRLLLPPAAREQPLALLGTSGEPGNKG